MKVKVVASVLITMLSTQASFAAAINHFNLATRIMETSSDLKNIAEQHKTETCSGDIEAVAGYLESSGVALKNKRKDVALVSMAYGQTELTQICTTRSYCAPLSPKLKPYLAKVNVLKEELEHVVPEPDNTSDYSSRTKR